MESILFLPLLYIICLSREVQSNSTICNNILMSEGNESTIPRNLILYLHNAYRQKLLNGEIDFQPQAEPGSIKMLKWHSKLGQEALKIARTCNFEHVRVNISEFREGVGQNLFRSCSNKIKMPDWRKPMEFWFQENDKYCYPDEPNAHNGHYTQLIWGDTEFVGCSLSQYIRNDKRVKTRFCTLYVCNYGPPGNVEGEPPYRALWP